MGYCSEVALILKKSDYDELMALVQPLKEKDQLGFLKNDPKSCEYDDEEYVCVHDDWIKWDNSYNEIDLIEKFIFDGKRTFGFVRVGEDGDLDFRYNNLNIEMPYVHTAIIADDFDIGLKKYIVVFTDSDGKTEKVGSTVSYSAAHEMMKRDVKKHFAEHHDLPHSVDIHKDSAEISDCSGVCHWNIFNID